MAGKPAGGGYKQAGLSNANRLFPLLEPLLSPTRSDRENCTAQKPHTLGKLHEFSVHLLVNA